ncbi:MAG: aspartate/glutamate racemase family protein [Granulosicoccus sp.]
MKTIGILGGMSAASTQLYYQHLCNLTQQQFGGLHSPELLIRSVNFAEIEHFQMSGNWKAAGETLNREARLLEQGGAQILLIATNTMHKLANEIMHGIDIPLIHIADATAACIKSDSLTAPGLMATRFTMEQDFYTGRLIHSGLHPVIPDTNDRNTTHRIIYEELCKNIISEDGRRAYEQIASRLIEAGADSLILGCTEVGMLLNSDNVGVPVYDTTRIHCEAALHLSLQSM